MLVRHSVNAFIGIDPNPSDRIARRETVNHHVFPVLRQPYRAQAVGVVHVGSIVCSPSRQTYPRRRVELRTCGFVCVVCIVDYRATGVNTPSCRTTPLASRPSHRGQCLRHPMRGRRRSSCRTPEDGGSVWRTRCARRFVPYGTGALRY